jgi:hypothetical protein
MAFSYNDFEQMSLVHDGDEWESGAYGDHDRRSDEGASGIARRVQAWVACSDTSVEISETTTVVAKVEDNLRTRVAFLIGCHERVAENT